MKPFPILLLLVIMTACQPDVKQPAITYVEDDTIPPDEFTKPFKEIITTDLNNDGKIDTITLADAPMDPGTFKKIRIALTGGTRHTFHAHEAWDTVDRGFLENNINAVNSPLVYVYKDKEQFAILLFGYPFGAGRDEMNIIYGKGNEFRMICKQPFSDAISLHPDNLDRLEFVARKSSPAYYGIVKLSDGKTGDVGTYAPFSVMSIREDAVILNITATSEYNREHYIWLGADASDEVKVLYFHDGRKPTIID